MAISCRRESSQGVHPSRNHCSVQLLLTHCSYEATNSDEEHKKAASLMALLQLLPAACLAATAVRVQLVDKRTYISFAERYFPRASDQARGVGTRSSPHPLHSPRHSTVFRRGFVCITHCQRSFSVSVCVLSLSYTFPSPAERTSRAFFAV